jgi:hypothetical protein
VQIKVQVYNRKPLLLYVRKCKLKREREREREREGERERERERENETVASCLPYIHCTTR